MTCQITRESANSDNPGILQADHPANGNVSEKEAALLRQPLYIFLLSLLFL